MLSERSKPFLYGGIASAFAEACTFPLDTLKTRLQVQGQKSTGCEIKYRGLTHGSLTILKQEGLSGFYHGIKPALLRQITYGTMRMGFYQSLKKLIQKDEKGEHLYVNVICGMVAGGLANGIANPTDVLKIRLQVNKDEYSKGMMRAFNDIFQKEGFKGLYRGMAPNVQRAAIITGVELPVYDFSKRLLVDKMGMLVTSYFTHFTASSIAGLIAALAATPIDVIKTRLMNQKKLKGNINSAHIYKGSMDCLVQTVKHEGFFALYKGLLPLFLRLGPWNIIFFMTYEQLKKSDEVI